MRGSRRLLLASVGGALFWGAGFQNSGAAPRGAERVKMQSTLVYQSTVADDRHMTSFTLAPSGVGTLMLGTNRDRRRWPVGRFEAPLSPELAQEIAAAASSPELAAAASQPSLVPDETYRRIEVTPAQGRPVVKLVGERLPPPPAVQRLEALVERAMAELSRAPQAALALRVQLPEQKLRFGTLAEVDVLLANVGPQTLRLVPPAQWGLQHTVAELSVLRNDVPVAALGPQHQAFVPLGSANFALADPPLAAGVITLSTGQRVRLRFRPLVEWPAGSYDLAVDLTVSVLGVDNQTLFVGGLVSEPIRVEVAK